ncbi:BspA family leucine-rich repeat surface protein, partial [Enterococcus faecalis]|nr:BspA family leucine-rich repeat surface protein [Enterococcus faecalis]
MKKYATFILVGGLLSASILPIVVNANEEPSVTRTESSNTTIVSPDISKSQLLVENKNSQKNGQWGTCSWTFDETTGTLEINSGELGESQLSPWNTGAVSAKEIKNIVFLGKVLLPENASSMFSSNISDNELTNLISLENMSNIDTSKVTNMANMFASCESLTTLDLSSFNTSNVTTMYGMFADNFNLQSINLSSFDTSKVTNMADMFISCENLATLDLSSFNTSSVEVMQEMFYDCRNLISLDLSNFDTSKVTKMHSMFSGCTLLESLDLSSFDTTNVLSMSNMFKNTNGLKKLTLGAKINTINGSNLPEIMKQPGLTGNWQNVGDGTVNHPNGNNVWTSSEFMANFQGNRDADTYVWQPQAAADVTVKYEDEEGNELHAPQTIKGNVGEDYDATTPQYQLTIPGYSLDQSKLPENSTGKLTEQAQTVVYVYKKDPVKAADITVKYE